MDNQYEITCNCSACKASEEAKELDNLPYRYIPGFGQSVFHLVQWFSVPLIGAILIGFSWWALVPFASFLLSYIVNSLIFCASCAYHHENVKLCGCFPKSTISFKLYNKPWGNMLNIFGWPGLIVIGVGPTIYVLASRNDWSSVVIYLLTISLLLLLTSTISCPNCRQRNVCYLGMLTLFLRKKQGYRGTSQRIINFTQNESG